MGTSDGKPQSGATIDAQGPASLLTIGTAVARMWRKGRHGGGLGGSGGYWVLGRVGWGIEVIESLDALHERRAMKSDKKHGHSGPLLGKPLT